MSHPKYPVSTSARPSLKPFTNKSQDVSLPWLCFTCGHQAAEISQKPITDKKSKINISKVIKNSKLSSFRNSLDSNSKIPTFLESNPTKKVQICTGSEQKSRISNFEGPQKNKSVLISYTNFSSNDKLSTQRKQLTCQSNYSYINAKNESKNLNPSISNSHITFNQNPEMFSINSKTKPQKLNFDVSSQFYHQKTQILKVKKQLRFSYNNQMQNLQAQQQKSIKVYQNEESQDGKKNYEVRVNLKSHKSYPNIEDLLFKKQDPFDQEKIGVDSFSKLSTSEEIPSLSFPQARTVQSIQESEDLLKKMKKEKISKKGKSPMALLNIKKTESRTSEEDELPRSPMSFGKKVRRVESMNSNAGDSFVESDQFSEVLQHGEKSFWMGQIDEADDEMSKFSYDLTNEK